MKNGKFTSTIIRMQYVPRWSEYAPRFEDNAASHSFRCAAIAILIGLIEEQRYNRSIDKLQLIARSLWGDLHNTGTGSIKYVTKKENLIKEPMRAFKQQISQEIVSYLSKSIQPFAHDYIINAKDNSYVGKLVEAIDTFDAMLFCYRETQFDVNPYFHTKYSELHEMLKSIMLPSIQWLMTEFDKKEGVFEFLNYIVNLDTIKRWNGSYNLVPDNDATHSFRTASLALFNGLLERERFGMANLNLYRLVCKAILHDLPEILCGDVVTNVKKGNDELRDAFMRYEHNTAVAMVEKLPQWFHKPLFDLMVNSKSNDIEGELVDIADKLDALIKANLEMRNNPHYAETYYQQLVHIQHTYEHQSVIFFLAYILHDLTFANLIRT